MVGKAALIALPPSHTCLHNIPHLTLPTHAGAHGQRGLESSDTPSHSPTYSHCPTLYPPAGAQGHGGQGGDVERCSCQRCSGWIRRGPVRTPGAGGWSLDSGSASIRNSNLILEHGGRRAVDGGADGCDAALPARLEQVGKGLLISSLDPPLPHSFPPRTHHTAFPPHLHFRW